ncbi:LOW QUALITY PROTEIN: 60S ribosomal protein L6, partial [Galemys pyrenaicus]
MKRKLEGGVLATVTKPAGGDKNGGNPNIKFHKVPRYPTEDAPQKLLSGGENLQPACERTTSRHHSWAILTILTGRHRARGLAVSGYSWLERSSSIKLPLNQGCTGNLSLPLPQRPISWIPKHLADACFKKLCKRRHQEGGLFHTEKKYEILGPYKADQKAVDSHICQKSKLFPAPGLLLLCVCSH